MSGGRSFRQPPEPWQSALVGFVIGLAMAVVMIVVGVWVSGWL